MWRIDSLGVKAEDFYSKDGNPVSDTYNTMWKMASPNDHLKVLSPVEEAQPAPPPKGLVDGDHKYTEAELDAMSKLQLAEIAASLGISDLTMPKARLIQTILMKQQ